MLHPRLLIRFTTGVALLALVSCESRARVFHGDATREGAIGGRLTNFWTEKFSIGTNEVHELEITGLTARAYPAKLRVHTREFDPSGYRGYTRWDRTVLRVELLDFDSRRKIVSKTKKLNRDFREVDDGVYEMPFFRPEELPLRARTEYRIRITVLIPSPREWDEASFLLQ